MQGRLDSTLSVRGVARWSDRPQWRCGSRCVWFAMRVCSTIISNG